MVEEQILQYYSKDYKYPTPIRLLNVINVKDKITLKQLRNSKYFNTTSI